MLNDSAIKLNTSIMMAFAAVMMLSIAASIYLQNSFYTLVPIGFLSVVVAITDYRYIFYALIASIPVSIHLLFGSLALDVASEPLMMALLVLFPLIFLIHYKEFNFLLHPIVFIIIVQYLWAFFSMLFSVDMIVSVKYLLAKLWFIIPFIFIGGLLLNKAEEFKKIFWLYFVPLVAVCVRTTFLHYQQGFGFDSANFVMQPFFHNHVDYSTAIAVFFPYVWFARSWYKPYSYKRLLVNLGMLILFIGIVFSYTRASWLAIAMLIPSYFVIKKNLTKTAILAGLTVLALALIYLYHNNKYLDYSKDYRKVIFHEGDIEGHLEATYQLEDVSGMERVYRWLAAKNMIEDKFFTGSGPNTFYPEYKKYTIDMFRTYVSDNPEMSTTHNYFLMVFAEQGVIGFLLFAGLYIFLLLKGTQLFHFFHDPIKKNLSIAATLSLMMLFLHLCFNDLIETDKTGSLFFVACAVLLKLDFWTLQDIKKQNK